MNPRLLSLLAVSLTFLVPLAEARLTVANVFQDHMVLQRDMPVPVWGWADANAAVSVDFAGQEKTAKSDEKGYWKAVLDPLKASTEGRPLAVKAGSDALTLNDVLVGEVWLCAGQSNMARTLKHDVFNYPIFKEYANDAEYPAIRFILYPTYASATPLADFDPVVQKGARWQLLNKTSAFDVMSMPFFFAKDLNKKLGVPVGLVQVAVAGTPQTAWVAKETLDEVAARYPNSPSYHKALATAEGNLAKGKEPYKDWAGFVAAETAWKASPTGRWPGSNQVIPDFPSVLYNALVYPLAPMAMRGVLWHQGEAGPVANYRERLEAQIAQWRQLFGSDFWFLWGTMTRNTGTPPPLTPDQASLRGGINEEFLLAAQDMAKGGRGVLVNFVDLGNNSTHWGRKEEGGHRFAKAAVAEVYGEKGTVYTGPELVEAKVDGATVRARFRDIGGGLVYEPSLDGISGFLLEEKGAKQELQWANVKVEGDTLILSHPDIKKPTNAYYGWTINPHETLFNREGYPALPFRLVPRVFAAKGVAGPALVELLNPPAKTDLNLSHVRRNGYIFNVVQDRGSGQATVRVRLPKEWKGATVTCAGRPVDTGALQTGPDGYRFYEFTTEINSPDIVVANPESPPDFTGVHRF
ncbi:sialate O-acetylesterase [soil metagenome]